MCTLFSPNCAERNVTAENLRQFVRMYSNDKLAVANCLEQFDEYAAEFMRLVQQSPIQSDQVDTFIKHIRHAISKLDNDQVSASHRDGKHFQIILHSN